jgi:hypothetical protein
MAPVTAAGSTPVDNATNQQPVNSTQGSPQRVDGGQAVAVVDDEPKEMTSDDDGYEAEKLAFLSAAPPPSPSTIPGASAADLAAQGLTPDGAPPASAPNPPQPSQPVPVVTAVPPVPEDDLEPGQGKLPRFNNVRAVDNIDVQALAAYKAAQKSNTLGGKSMVQFMAEFAGPKGKTSEPVTTPADAGQASPPPVDTTKEPTTVAEVDAQLQALRQERYRLLEGFDFAEAAKIEQQEDALRSRRDAIRESEAVSQVAAQTAAEQADTAALARVASLFPQSANPADPLVAKCNEIVERWEAEGNALLSQPNRYLYAYTEAAAELGISPAAASAPQSPPPVQIPSTTAPAHRPPTSAILASGQARDIPRAPVSDSLDDYEKEKAALLSGSFARRAA